MLVCVEFVADANRTRDKRVPNTRRRVPMPHMEETNKAKERINKDFKLLVDDAHALLKATADDTDKITKEARDKLAERLSEYRERYSYVEDAIVGRAEQVDHFVKDKPYQAMGAALGVGLLVGWLFSRK
ncbi:DUF883 domain-containing protein [Oceanidesulfovibrio marinus]|uniref:DUF883 domain-containing protein n=2 Tax=Oceanidesulfovibrio marinus TaxID=370038 RepID=A0ABX6NC45_9BACT|nr:DUF883 domain-containing protein [Oceanidesulfovibrio marinus]